MRKGSVKKRRMKCANFKDSLLRHRDVKKNLRTSFGSRKTPECRRNETERYATNKFHSDRANEEV
jgi:hypothetical protein